MKLVDLEPKWITNAKGQRVGLSFRCPLEPCRIYLAFSNPLDDAQSRPGWQRHGDDFRTMTLYPTPFIKGQWHGAVVSGEVKQFT